ncbi:hypothetical protein CERSUDRAFT_96608 [Gelatoporia subvermispora B]|uniref:Uncharacterized protein n=1 Tax=Ceriporiopsis subvermispora (strain B) TaxID=914234 RepID=M2RAP2_CERS8|nr:hypothetical protein CERSUDRAFT_96608 [Gelatoporia subvermispora B]
MSNPTNTDSQCGQKDPQAHSTPKQEISDLISHTFQPFDHRSAIVEPFDNESKRDVEFLEKLMLEFHAWSSARPSYESDHTADALESEVKSVIEMEKEQGTSLSPLSTSPSFVERTRQALSDFITRIRLALATLTDLSA